MSQERNELDANEPASQFKLDKARRRGSIARSSEVTFACVLVACVACVYGLGERAIGEMAALVRSGLPFASRGHVSSASMLAYGETLLVHALTLIAPIVFVLWTAATVVGALQARGVFTAHPLQPDFSRLSPATGLKRLLSVKSLHELWRSAAKLTAICAVMILWGRQHLAEILNVTGHAARSMTQAGLDWLGSALTLLAVITILFAALDWIIVRWEFMRRMRMSKREVKDEHKEREGDPRIRSRLAELRREWQKRMRQLAQVRNADVVLTNPTHYAVAIEYRRGEMPAPMITASGAGEMARRIRIEARRRNVPVVEHALLARALFAVHESAAFVPEEHFDQVACVLRWVYAARGAMRGAPA